MNGETAESPLQDIFPGETVTLRDGRTVVVAPWGFKALMREVPAILGRLMVKLAPLQSALKGALGGTGIDFVLPVLLEQASDEIVDLAAWSVGFSREDFSALGAADGLKLMNAVFRQNRDFFDELVGLARNLMAARSVVPASSGTPSTSPSDAPASVEASSTS